MKICKKHQTFEAIE